MKLKDKVLSRLIKENTYCSGTNLSEEFGVTRTAIWKAVEQLKAEGYQIAAVPRRGYLLLQKSDIFQEDTIQELLKGCHINWKIQPYHMLDSTNRLAKDLAAQGASEGTVIMADVQTAGRGRMGKSFHSPKGGMYMSIILRPDMAVTSMMSITACTASAVHMALAEYGIISQIKWVNDLFLHEKKIGGILSEGSFQAESGRMEYLVIGIGINVHPDPEMPEELKPIVTDLETETGRNVPRYALAALILKHLEKFISEIENYTYLGIYQKHSCTLGHIVRTDDGREGKAIGFTKDAGLVMQLENQKKEVIRTGSVKIIR